MIYMSNMGSSQGAPVYIFNKWGPSHGQLVVNDGDTITVLLVDL